MLNARREKALASARNYIGTTDGLKELGSGAGGVVFASPSSTAIKVFQYSEPFIRELAVYERLRDHRVIDVRGFAVPRLVNFHADSLIVEMTMVQAPFLLDFEQAYLDEPCDFPEGHMEQWWENVAADFGERFAAAQAVYYELINQYGIYYYDLAPRNLNFGNSDIGAQT